MSKFVLISVGGRSGNEYEVREMGDEVMGCDVFKDWEMVSDGVWCEENSVVVVGESKSDCVERLSKFDEVGDEVVGGWGFDWVLSLKSGD